MSALDELRKKGLIEKIEPDQATATRWLDDAGRHLEAATKIAELDPTGAYVLAYDAAMKSIAAALLMSGYRAFSAARDPTRLSRNTPSRLRFRSTNRPSPAWTGSGATAIDPSTDHGASARPRSRRPSTRHKRFARHVRALPESATESDFASRN